MTAKEMKEKSEKLIDLFYSNVFSWTEEKQKEAFEYKSSYLSDYSYSLFPEEEITKEERKQIIDLAEKEIQE